MWVSGIYSTLNFVLFRGLIHKKECDSSCSKCNPVSLSQYFEAVMQIHGVPFLMWMKTVGKGSVEVWNLCWCFTGHRGAVSFFLSVCGRKHEKGLSFTPRSKFLEPLCWKLPQFITQTLIKPLWGAGHFAGTGYAKTVPVEGNRKAE